MLKSPLLRPEALTSRSMICKLIHLISHGASLPTLKQDRQQERTYSIDCRLTPSEESGVSVVKVAFGRAKTSDEAFMDQRQQSPNAS